MASKSFPFESTYTGVDSSGIPQGDRGATSADWAQYVSRMFTDGYFRNPLDGQLKPAVSAIPMAVDIAAGSAMIMGRQYSLDEVVTVSLGLSDSLPRIDRIVLRMSTEVEDRKISLVVLKGTPAASPVAPELTRSVSVYDICLAQITVGANVVQIVENDLTDTRDDEELCGYVKLLLDGRYYPNGSIPELLWVYTMYPETLTPEQKAYVEGNTEFIDLYESSNMRQIDIKATQNKIPPGTIGMFIGDGVPDGFIYANGALVSNNTYSDLYDIIGDTYAGIATMPLQGNIVKIKGITFIYYNGKDFAACDISKESLYSYEPTITLAMPFTGGTQSPNYIMTIVNDSIYVIGGETVSSGTGTAVTTCKRAKVTDKNNIGTWETLASLPEPRYSSAIAVYNNKYIYCIGGITTHGNASQFDSSVKTTVYKAEILSNGTLSAWSTLTALPQTLSHTSALILGNKLYVLGGVYQPNGMSDPYCTDQIRVATIDPATGNLSAWSTYTVTLPTTVITYRALKLIAEGKIFITLTSSSTWYSADIIGDGFSSFSLVDGWTGSNPSPNYLYYEDGYLYEGNSTTVYYRKYVNGVFGVRNSLRVGVLGSFKLPDLRDGVIQFATTPIASVTATGGGVTNQSKPLIRPIPCLKY